jgi:hypothetical protein
LNAEAGRRRRLIPSYKNEAYTEHLQKPFPPQPDYIMRISLDSVVTNMEVVFIAMTDAHLYMQSFAAQYQRLFADIFKYSNTK